MDNKKSPEEIRSKIMRAVKSKGSKIEITLMKALWSRGMRYRKHVKSLVGTPDIVFSKRKVVVFCDSEFWHGKNWEERKHDIKTRQDFWYKKIERNIAKDIEVNEKLRAQGWIVIRFWGKDIMKDVDKCCDEVLLNLTR